MRLQPQSFLMAALLTALVAIAPLSTNMYLPALPDIAQHFQAPMGDVQLTLSMYLVGFAVGQLILGPLSDRFGRRPVLIGGLIAFCIASIACWLASNVALLIFARLFQAVGACAGVAISRAMVRDIHGTHNAAHLLTHMGTAMAVAPLIAPLIGGVFTAHYGWQSNFIVLAGVGLFLLLLSAFALPESHAPSERVALSPKRMGMNYKFLTTHPEFRDFALVNAFAFAGLFAFSSASSFVLIDGFGIGATAFGFAFAVVVVGFMTGSQISVRLLKRMEIERLIGLGGRIALVAGIAGLLTVWLAPPSVLTVIAPMFCYNVAVGFIMPNAMAGSIGPFPQMAGAAAALMGFIQMITAAAAGALVGQVHDHTPVPMLVTVAVCGLLAWVFARRVERRALTRQTPT